MPRGLVDMPLATESNPGHTRLIVTVRKEREPKPSLHACRSSRAISRITCDIAVGSRTDWYPPLNVRATAPPQDNGSYVLRNPGFGSEPFDVPTLARTPETRSKAAVQVPLRHADVTHGAPYLPTRRRGLREARTPPCQEKPEGTSRGRDRGRTRAPPRPCRGSLKRCR